MLSVTKPDEESLQAMFWSGMIALYQNQCVLVYNNCRQVWEIPGGKLDDEETARQAAIREFFEESAQRAQNVSFVAEISIAEPSKDRVIKGAVFTCNIESLLPFKATDEIRAIKLWHPNLTEPLDIIDETLIRLVI